MISCMISCLSQSECVWLHLANPSVVDSDHGYLALDGIWKLTGKREDDDSGRQIEKKHFLRFSFDAQTWSESKTKKRKKTVCSFSWQTTDHLNTAIRGKKLKRANCCSVDGWRDFLALTAFHPLIPFFIVRQIKFTLLSTLGEDTCSTDWSLPISNAILGRKQLCK